MFTIIDTPFSGLKLIDPLVHGDARGYFFEAWKKSFFEETGLDCEFIQDNESRSAYGVVRGLHWQAAPYAQTKLLRVVTGRILDVVVDPAHRSQGIGRTIVSRLAEHLASFGIDWIVCIGVPGTEAFYRAAGATSMDGHTAFRFNSKPGGESK